MFDSNNKGNKLKVTAQLEFYRASLKDEFLAVSTMI